MKDEPIIVMNLCEYTFLCLHPNILYRFIVAKDCEKCKELAKHSYYPENHEQRDP